MEGAQLRVLMRASGPDPVGLRRLCVRHLRVLGTVCVGRVCVHMALDSIAQLTAGLCPTWLGVVDRSGSGCWLTRDAPVGRREG